MFFSNNHNQSPHTPEYFGPVDSFELEAIKQICQSATDLSEPINYQETIDNLANQIFYTPRYYNPNNLNKKIQLAKEDLTQSAKDKPIDLALDEYEQGQTDPPDFRLTAYQKTNNQYSADFQKTLDFWHKKEKLQKEARQNLDTFCQFMHCDAIPKNLKRCYALYHLYRHLFYNYHQTYPFIECYLDQDYINSHQLPSFPLDFPIQNQKSNSNNSLTDHDGNMIIPETPITIEKKLLDLHFPQEEAEHIIEYFKYKWQITPTSH